MVPYFAALGVAVLILSRAEPTPLHALFSLLPGFERIHARSPERALIVLYLAPAMLSAATLTWVMHLTRRAALPIGLAAVALVSLNLHLAWTAQAAEALAGGGDYQFARVNLNDYLAPIPGARFLQEQQQAQAPFRVFGFAGHVFGGPMPYTLRWSDPAITALQVNNRGLLTGLEDIQGYNPVHIARYGDLIDALNGLPQNYHQTDIFPSGLDSPLVDLLNARYIVMPAVLASDEVAPPLTRPLTRVYADDTVQIFENPAALPRAWLVHSALQVAPGTSIATLSGDPRPDPRKVAILETTPPALDPSSDTSSESVAVMPDAPDHLQVQVVANAAALLVMSEIAYPAWQATLDGQPVPIQLADGALRAVAVPPGTHVVDMAYRSQALEAGLVVSALTAALLLAVACAAAANSSREHLPRPHPTR